MKKRNLPIQGNLLHRGRIDQLLGRGLEYPLVTVVAGPGYGKTQAVAAFAQNMGRRLVWMYLSDMENSIPRFWEKFCDTVGEELPELEDELREMGFPEGPADFDNFLRVFTRALYTGEQIVMVMDNCHNIKIDRIIAFIERIIASGLENFCLILISSEKRYLNVGALKHDGSVFSLTMEDLRFTHDEARQWFDFHGIALDKPQLDKLMEDTGGWPLALFLLTTKYVAGGGELDTRRILPLTTELFEVEYYARYSPEMQRLLIKLSLLGDFTPDIVRDLGGVDLAEAVRELTLHVFIVYDFAAEFFSLHKMYRDFIAHKQFLLSKDEIDEVYMVAGDRFFKSGRMFNAIYCYRACACYEKLYDVLLRFPFQRKSHMMAAYCLECLQLIPDEMRAADPTMDFYIGMLYLNNACLDESSVIMDRLTAQLEAKGDGRTASESRLLGEVYAVQGDIRVLTARPGFVEYYEGAARLLPQGSKVRNAALMYVPNHSVFFLPENGPGALDEVLDLVARANPFIEAISNGSGYGYDLLFAAEAAYAVCALDKAKQLSFQAIYKARERAQHDIVCNAYFLLARVARAQGDVRQTGEYLTTIGGFIDSHNLPGLYEMRDCANAWFALMMGNLDDLPRWMTEADNPQMTLLTTASGRSQMLYALWLYHSARYHESLAALGHIIRMKAQEGQWSIRLVSYIVRAACHLRCGEVDPALKDFYQACEYTRHNGIVMPFLEFGDELDGLITKARQSKLAFDDGWLRELQAKAAQYPKRSALLARQQRRRPEQRTAAIPPTERELEVLNQLAAGQTREEIALSLGISVNGVKKHITNIYNKLGAINRAEAIHIAITSGFIT